MPSLPFRRFYGAMVGGALAIFHPQHCQHRGFSEPGLWPDSVTPVPDSYVLPNPLSTPGDPRPALRQ